MKTTQKLVLIILVAALSICNRTFGADGGTKTTEQGDTSKNKFKMLLLKAIEAGNLKLVKEWLDHGADVNAPSTNDRTPLMFAAYKGYQEIVELLLDRGASIDHKDSNGDTTLMYAVLIGRLDIIKLLLDRKANLDQKNKNGVTALILAADKSHENVVKLLLDRKANINHKDSTGATALVCAAGEGCPEIVALLLNRGAGTDQETKDGVTALIEAAGKGHEDIVELLLDRGAGIDHQDSDGGTALMHATARSHINVVKLLLDHGANKNARSKNTRRNALDLAKQIGNQEIIKLLTATDAAEGETKTTEQGDTSKNKFQNLLSKAIETGNLKLVEEWLNRGADINYLDTKDDLTPLIFAAFSGRLDVVKLLLDRGANIDHKDSDGTTALIAAAAKGHKEIVELLLDRKANIDHKDSDSGTALMRATVHNHKNVVKLLLDRGADKNTRTKKFKQTALDFAKRTGNEEIIKLLTATDAAEGETKTTEQGDTSKNKFQNLLSKAIETGNLKLVEEWLNRGADINYLDTKDDLTPLIFAAFSGRLDVVKLLLDRGANINQKNKDGIIALMCAADGHKDIVRLLLDRGANIDNKNKDDVTALMMAAHSGQLDVVELLLDRKANIDHKDSDSGTALMRATVHNHKNVVKLLLDRGADKNTRTKKFKQTALDIAKKTGNEEIIKLLTEKRPNRQPSDATTTPTNTRDETKEFDQVSVARTTPPAENTKKPKKNNKNSAQQLISDLETLIIYDDHKTLEKKLDNFDPEQNSNDKQTVVSQLVNFALARDKYKAIQLLVNHQAVLNDDHYKQFVDAKNISALEALLPISSEEHKNKWSPELDALKAELTRETEAATVRAEQKERAAEKERLAQEEKDALYLAEKQAAERARIAAQRNTATLEGAVHLPNTQKIRAANPKKLQHKTKQQPT